MYKKLFIIGISGLFIISCGNKSEPANPNAEVDIPISAQPERNELNKIDVTISTQNNEKKEDPKNKTFKAKGPLIGMFVCKKTTDKYIFNEDGTGYFFTNGTNSEFKWSLKDDMLTIIFEVYGKEYLLFDQKKNTLKENSETFGTLIFEKQ